MERGPDLQLRKPNKFLPQYFGIAIGSIASIILLGWQFDVDFFVRTVPGLGAAHPLVAMGLLAIGLFFIIRTTKDKQGPYKVLIFILPYLPILIGLIKLSELFLGLPFHIDTLVYASKLAKFSYKGIPDHITACTAFEFVLSGTALMAMNFNSKRSKAIATNMALVIAIVAVLSCISCVYLIQDFNLIVFYTAMAISVVFCFLLTALAIMFSFPESGFLAAFQRSDSGRLMSRIFIPLSIIIPVVFGSVTLYVLHITSITPAAWVTLLVIALIFSQFLLTWYIGAETNKNTARKFEEEQLRKSEYYYRSIIENAMDAIVISNMNGNLLEVNSFASELFGYTKDELLQLNFKELIDPVQLKVDPIGFDIIRSGKSSLRERRLVTKEGKIIETRVNAKKLPDGRVLTFIHDITEEKQEEIEFRNLFDELAISETKFRNLFEFSAIGMAIVSLEGKYLKVNKELCAMVGYSESEFLSKSFQDYTHPDDLEESLDFVRKIISGEIASFYIEKRYLHKNGSTIWVYLSTTILRDGNGKALYFVSQLVNITDRKRAERELVESEEKYRSLIEQASDAIWVIDGVGNFVEVNNSLCVMSGYSKEELLSLHLSALVDPEQLKNDPLKYDLPYDGRTILKERLMRRKDGNLIISEWHVKRVTNNRIMAIARDVTELRKVQKRVKESEARFRTLVENNFDAITLLDSNYKPLYRSPATIRVTGWLDTERDNPGYDMLHPDDYKQVEEVYKKAKENEGVPFLASYRIKHKNGNYIWVEAVIRNMLSDPDIGATIVVLRDVTDRKNAEREIMESSEKYRLLFESSPLPMWFSSLPELKIIDVNEAAIKLYGYSREEFTSLNLKDLRPPEDINKFLSSVEKKIEGTNSRGIWRHFKKNGEIIDVEVFTHDIELNGSNRRLILINDVTEKLKAEEELHQVNEQLRYFSSHLQDVREEERTHISREIHDELGQLLTGLKINVSWLSKKLNAATENDVSQRMDETLQLTDRTIQSVRRIATELRPGILDDLGLEEAIIWQAEEFKAKTGISCEVNGKLKIEKYSPQVATTTFRILQESLTNIMRHAGAKHVTINLKENDLALHLEVIDDGTGINNNGRLQGKSLGIMGMRERASIIGGSFTINSEPLKGTRIEVEIPFKSQL